MSRYAKINAENIVESVIICDDSNISLFSGKYIKEASGTKEANIGDTWDEENNKFVAPKPFESWELDESFEWQPPVNQSVPNSYWDEESLSWVVTQIIKE